MSIGVARFMDEKLPRQVRHENVRRSMLEGRWSGVIDRALSCRMVVRKLWQTKANQEMPTLVIDNMPLSLYDRIQGLAKAQRQTPADAVIEVLESAFRLTTPKLVEAPLPDPPFLTEEICAPCSIQW